MDGCWLDHGTEGLREINTRTLGEVVKDPMRLVAFKRTISFKLMFKDPLVGDHVALRRSRNEIPCMVSHKSIIISFHCGTPIGISEGGMIRPRNRREWRSLIKHGQANASLAPRDHAVLVEN